MNSTQLNSLAFLPTQTDVQSFPVLWIDWHTNIILKDLNFLKEKFGVTQLMLLILPALL